METLAEGWWCTRCEFFHLEGEVDETDETCQSCGCNGSDHRRVEIIAKAVI